MKRFMLTGVAAGFLLGSASVGLAGPNVGQGPLGSHGRELARERAEHRREAGPYALTGERRKAETAWEMRIQRNVSGRVKAPAFKRVPAESPKVEP